ncbi:hypothetical protein EBU95_14425 [bacterium]|nr:hypothetical protein [bacterium]
MEKVFNAYVNYHRDILIEGIAEYPQYFKKSDLIEFDTIINIVSEQVEKENLYEHWNPIIIYKNPIDYLKATEEEILVKIFDHSSNGKKLLYEQIDPEVALKDVSAAFKSQIIAIQKLREHYESLDSNDKKKLNDKTSAITKSGKNFIEEIESIEDELNSAFGKLKKGGFFKKLAASGFGNLQRLLANVFGIGEVDNANVLNEQKMELAQLALNSPVAREIANVIRNALYSEKTNLLTRGVANKIAAKYGIGINDVANVAHNIGANVQGTLGTLTPVGKTALGSAGKKLVLGSAGKGIAATSAPTGTTSAAASAAKAVGLGLGTKLTITTIGLLLVAAGLAGAAVKNRANRIVQLQKIATLVGNKKIRIPDVKTISQDAGAITSNLTQEPESTPQLSRKTIPQFSAIDIPQTEQQTSPAEVTATIVNAESAIDKLIQELKRKFPRIEDKITRKKVVELVFMKNKKFSAINASDFGSSGDVF